MRIKLTKKYPNVSRTFSNEQLGAIINDTIKKTFSNLEKMIAVKNAIHDTNPYQTEETLNIQITKLWSWNGHRGTVAIGGKKKNRSCDISSW